MTTIARPNYRGKYHFSPRRNWMNDPNGLVYFAGEYHLFYQHYPHGTTWGPMHWGHAVSKDLVRWEELDIALAPDENGTIFSGSAVVDWRNTTGFFAAEPGLVAIFTHHLERPGKPPLQTQSLAYSKDKGRTWTKYEGNPVLAHDELVDFRDPKVFWHENTGRWIMILACGQTVCLYHSPDLKTWTFGSEFGRGVGFHGGVWECPDLFPLAVDGDASRLKWVMLVSVGDAPAYKEGSRTQYFIGDFDGVTFTPDQASPPVRWLDYGRDNYAAVSWSDIPAEDGRRLLVGWMSNWKYANLTPTEDFRGAATLPRELTLETRGGEAVLVQRPARELARARVPLLALGRTACAAADAALRSLQLDSCELVAEAASDRSFAFKVRAGEGQETLIGFDAAAGEVYVDRTRSGQHAFHEHFRGVHAAKLQVIGDAVRLHIWVDRSSVEVFAGEGEAVITDLIFPDAGSTGMGLIADQEDFELISLTVHQLEPSAMD
ncbi:glycoside hydrolase family 32 protein [Paenibacillus ginsengihumi]|uniref:glycoside hydrolase family 32 protein n=1 Tax=Paenibacillus ginsengihumi TaxID=431596 RepID=UPI000372F55D|nr:glycoside hydrolase family 32 protein [Paenibacillus ginsengihumi]